MADITPVTREEYYLAKAGGQDVPVPSAVTREEYYLEKLSNDSVVVPSPVTRREKFLYFACGGEIDLPSEEKMTRLERLIAKAGGMDVSTPTAVTRLEKFWANVEGGGWKTITGVLPLTFTAKGGNAVDWVIEGNDESYNLWNGTFEQGTTGGGQPQSSSNRVRSNTFSIMPGEYTFVFNNFENYQIAYDMRDKNYAYIGGTGWLESNTFTPGNDVRYLLIKIRRNDNGDMTPQEINDIMLVKGSTAPDHYIPYQKGVGERTENLLKITAETQTVNQVQITINTDKTVTVNGTASKNIYFDLGTISFPPGTYTLSSGGVGITSDGMAVIYAYDEQYHICNPNDKTWTLSETKNVSFVIWISDGKTVDNLTFKPMFVKGSTPPETYIPHGYQIPLTVSQQGQPDKSYNIYIGDSPLTEGETVSKTSTGVDIELFKGENTVSTTLYNKPEMEIRYK